MGKTFLPVVLRNLALKAASWMCELLSSMPLYGLVKFERRKWRKVGNKEGYHSSPCSSYFGWMSETWRILWSHHSPPRLQGVAQAVVRLSRSGACNYGISMWRRHLDTTADDHRAEHVEDDAEETRSNSRNCCRGICGATSVTSGVYWWSSGSWFSCTSHCSQGVQAKWETSEPEAIGMEKGVRFLGAELWKREDGAWLMTQANYIKDLLKRNLGSDPAISNPSECQRGSAGYWRVGLDHS